MKPALTALLLALAGCATAPPPPPPPPAEGALLALPPAALGAEVQLAQRVTLVRGAERRAFDAQLEVDAQSLQLAVFALGQTVARITWDGLRLTASQAVPGPAVVSAEAVVSDIQLAFWPEAAVRAGLPAGLTLEVAPGRRRLLREGAPVIEVRYEGAGPAFPRLEVDHVLHGFQLIIESRGL